MARTRAVAAAREALCALADGAWDVQDPLVQRHCRRVAAHLRHVLTLEDVATPVGRWLVRVLDVTYDRGVDLRLRVTDSVPVPGSAAAVWPWRAQAALGSSLVACVRHAPPDSTVTLTIRQLAGETRVSLLGPASLAPVARDRARMPRRHGFGGGVEEIDQQTLAWVTRPLAATGGAAGAGGD